MSSDARRPIEQGDWNMAFLFPGEIVEARARTGLAILPLAPIEWHGPHLAMDRVLPATRDAFRNP